MLKVELQTEILALYYGDKKSVRAIAQRLGINRKSVAAVVAPLVNEAEVFFMEGISYREHQRTKNKNSNSN